MEVVEGRGGGRLKHSSSRKGGGRENRGREEKGGCVVTQVFWRVNIKMKGILASMRAEVTFPLCQLILRKVLSN
jgi:hypothetical protein